MIGRAAIFPTANFYNTEKHFSQPKSEFSLDFYQIYASGG